MTTSAIMNTYGRLPVSFTHGEGVWLFDQSGQRFLDAISGIGVNALGHAHPAIANAVAEQSKQLIHTSNLYGIARQQELAEKLIDVSGMSNVFFSNSGAEANEAAIKIARRYGHQRGIDRPSIVVLDNAFHGRTMATLSASGNRKIQAGFEPLVTGFTRAGFGNIEALQNIAKNNADVVAVLVEPIQGEGGVNVLPENHLKALRELCDANQWLLMLDEVQTGNGRTGQYFAFQHENIRPDVVTTAKGLGGGLPIGACLASGAAADILQPGSHGSTYGGNPLCCAAGLAVVNTIQQNKLIDNAAQIGNMMLSEFTTRLADCAAVTNIRGKGLMMGIELNAPCQSLVQAALEQQLLINVTAERVIRLLPPLIINQNQAEQIVTTVCELVRQFKPS